MTLTDPSNGISLSREGLVITSPERRVQTRVVIEDGHYVIKTVEDYSGLLELNHELGSAGNTRSFSGSSHAARMPSTLYRQKVREFGGHFGDDDPLVRAKWTAFLNSNEYHRLRVCGKAL